MLFKGLAHEDVRARFAALDREIMSLNARYAASVLDARSVPMGSRSGPIGQWSDLPLIDHELAKQKRHVPIRQLVNRAGDALKALKPCFMMSPLSVAQYLEPGRLVFDLVVMDEASQLKPEDALGAIARGGQLVITQRSQPAIAIGYARRSLRAMAGKSIESGQQTGLRINGMRRLDCCSFYPPPDWKRLVPDPTPSYALQCTV